MNAQPQTVSTALDSNQRYKVVFASVDNTPAYLLQDSIDQRLVATCIDAATADFIAERLNRANSAVALTSPHLLTSPVELFCIQLEIDLGELLAGQYLDASMLLSDLCNFFSLNAGEQAIALGPKILADGTKQMTLPASLTDQHLPCIRSEVLGLVAA